MKPTRRLRWAGLLALLLVLGIAGLTFALPQDGSVVGGSATIEQVSPERLNVIQSTDKAIINWRSFDIDVNEHADFKLPKSSSVNLSRVTGGDPSDILGRLTSNGHLFLINPSGIIFGRNAQIDVAGIVASTSDITNENFMSGNYQFNIAPSATGIIQNKGTINVTEGGLAAFVAPGVRNSGLISARLGRVTLASGTTFTLDLYGDQLVNLGVDSKIVDSVYDSNGNKLTSLIDNSGSIFADGGRVILDVNAAAGIVDRVISMKGEIVARTVEQKNGVIVLNGGDEGIVNVTGTLDASGKNSGETGGTVHALGDKVGLFDTASVDVSGDAGGGTALIGGDYKGGGDVDTSTAVYVASTATISADALTAGHGGKIIVWSEEVTRAYGTFNARGGSESGDGGFLETSSAKFLDVNGIELDLTAANGDGGLWLIDPENVDIVSDAVAEANLDTDSGTKNGDPTVFESDGEDNVILRASTIVDELEDGIDVIVDTSGDEETTSHLGGAEGNIRVLSAIEPDFQDPGDEPTSGAVTLIFKADNNIEINAPITATGLWGLNVDLRAGKGTQPDTIEINAPITTNGGSVQVDSGTTATSVTLLRADIDTTGSGAHVIFFDPVRLDQGDVSIITGGGDITFQETVVGVYGLTLDAGVETDTDESSNLEDGGADIKFKGDVGGFTAVSGLGFLTIKAVDTLELGDGASDNINILGALTMESAGSQIIIPGTNFALRVGSAVFLGTQIDIDGDITSTGSVSFTQTGVLNATDAAGFDWDIAGGLTINGAAALGADISTQGGEVNFSGSITLQDDITIDTTDGGNFTPGANVVFQSTVGSSSSADLSLTIDVGTEGTAIFDGDVGLTAKTALEFLTVTGAAHLDTEDIVTAGGAVTFNGPVTLFQNVDIQTNGASFDDSTNLTGADIKFLNTVDSESFSIWGLDLDPGTGGSITFGGIVGGIGNGKRLGDVTVDQVVDLTATHDFYAESFTQTAGTGTTEFNGLLDLSDNTLDVNGVNFTFGDVNDAGNVSITHTGLLTMNGLFDIGGSFTEFGAGGTVRINDGGGVKTNDSDITFFRTITGEGSVLIDSFQNDKDELDTDAATNGKILFTGSINSTGNPFDLTVNAGDETVTFFAVVGNTDPLRDLTIVNSEAAAFVETLTMTGALTQTNAATGKTDFRGDLNVGSADLRGQTYDFDDDVNSTGEFHIDHVGDVDSTSTTDPWNLDGGFFSVGTPFSGDLIILNDIVTKGGEVSIDSDLDLAQSILIDTTNGGSHPQGADVSFLDVVNSSNSTDRTLQVKAGENGKVLFSAIVGGVNELQSLQVLSGTTQIGANITVGGGAILFEGAVELLGGGTITLDTTGTSTEASGADITFSNALYSQSGLFTSLSLDAGDGTSGSVLFGGVVGGSGDGLRLGALEIGDGADGIGAHDVTAEKDVYATSFKQTGSAGDGVTDFQGMLDLSGNTLTVDGVNFIFNDVNDAGAAAIGHTGTLQLLGDFYAAGGFEESNTTATPTVAGGTVTIDNGKVRTDDTAIHFNSVIEGNGDVLIDTGPGTGTLTFDATVNKVNNGPFDLTVNSGTAVTKFTGFVGGTRPLNSLTSINSAGLEFTGNLNLSGPIVQVNAATGKTDFKGDVSLGGDSVLRGTTFDVDNDLDSTGSVTFYNSGTFDSSAAADTPSQETWDIFGGLAIIGNFDQSTLLGANIDTKGGEVRFADDVTLEANITIDTTNEEDDTKGANIIFERKIDSDTADRSLTLNAGTEGIVTLDNDIGGSNPLQNFTVHGTAHVDTRTINTGGGTVSFNGDVVLTEDLEIDTTKDNTEGGTNAAGADVTFTESVLSSSGEFNDLTVDAGTGGSAGTVTFLGQVGDNEGERLGSVVIDGNGANDGTQGALNVFAFNDFFAESLRIDAENTGAVEFHGLLDITNPATIDIDGGAVILNDVKTINGGTVTVTNALTLTIVNGSVLDLDGKFHQDGAGAVLLGGDIFTTDDDIEFDGGVTLTKFWETEGPVVLDTETGEGDIDFGSTVDGEAHQANNLTLQAGSGNIDFRDHVGGTVAGADRDTKRLGWVQIRSVQDFTAAGEFHAWKIDQWQVVDDTPTTEFKGLLTTREDIHMHGVDFIFNAVETNFGGEFLIEHSGELQLLGDLDLDGQFEQLAHTDISETSGTVTFGANADINTTGKDIFITGAVTLAGDGGTNKLDTTVGQGVEVPEGEDVGDVFFLSTIDDDAVDGDAALVVDAGPGRADFNGVIGGTNELDALTVTASHVIFLNNVTVNKTISVNTTEHTFADGDTTFLSSAGSAIDFDDISIGTAIDHTMTIDNSAGSGNVEIDGVVEGRGGLEIFAGSGDVDFLGKVGYDIAFAQKFAELGSVELALEALGIEDLAIEDIVDADIPFPLDHLRVDSTGTITVNNDVLAVEDIIFNGNVVVTGTDIESEAGHRIEFNGDLTLSGDDVRVLSRGGANEGVFFQGFVNGPAGLFVDAAVGNVEFQSNVGHDPALKFLTVNGFDIFFRGSIHTDGMWGIDLTGRSLDIADEVVTEYGGNFRFLLDFGFTQSTDTGDFFNIAGKGIFQTTGDSADIILNNSENAIQGPIFFNTVDGDVELNNGMTETKLSGDASRFYGYYDEYYAPKGEVYLSKFKKGKGRVRPPEFRVNGNLRVETGNHIVDKGPIEVTGGAEFIVNKNGFDIDLTNPFSIYNVIRFETGNPAGDGNGGVNFRNGDNGGNPLFWDFTLVGGDIKFATNTDLITVGDIFSNNGGIDIYVGLNYQFNQQSLLRAKDDIMIQAGDMFFGPNSRIQSTGNGDIDLWSARFINMQDGSVFETGRGMIKLWAKDDIDIGKLKTGNDTNWAVEVFSWGQIRDGGDQHGNDVWAPNGRVNFFGEDGVFLNPGNGADREPELNVESIDIQSPHYNPWRNLEISVTEASVQRTQLVARYSYYGVNKTNFIPLDYGAQYSLNTDKRWFNLNIEYRGDTFRNPIGLIEPGVNARGEYDHTPYGDEDYFQDPRRVRFGTRYEF